MEDFQLIESGDKSGVSVVVRIRPPNSRETTMASNSFLDSSRRTCVRVEPLSNDTMLCVDTNPPKLFTFDHVASPQATQRDMFDRCGRSIVESCLDGYNGTIFCYGQTGAGKTFTMIGPDQNTLDESRGLIPRILEALFQSIEHRKTRSHFEASLQVSFLEIYNERITDLLIEPDIIPNIFNQPVVLKSLQLREDAKQGVYVEDLSHHTIDNAETGMEFLRIGLANRHVGATKSNEQSSRSHSVFTVTIQSKLHEPNGVTRVKTSYLHLIDLAGSERQQNTQADGDRLTEACSINKSLSALGNVIMSLVDKAKGRARHVHYRDSKLTFLLKDSLGGNSRTCIVANISGSVFQLSETLGTLKFAQRAKFIKNRPVVNESDEGNVTALQQQIMDLRKIIANMQDQQAMNVMVSGNNNQQPWHQQHISQHMTETKKILITESEKEEYEKRVSLILERMEQSEKLQDYLQNQVEQYAKIAKGKEMLLHATKLALKLKECSLAKLENREPNIGESLLKLDYLHDYDLDDQSDSDMEDDEFVDQPLVKKEMTDTQRLEKLLKKIWHPDRHPTVVSFAMENYELREKLERYESGNMMSRDSDKISGDEYTKELQRQIRELVKAKHEKLNEVDEQSSEKQEHHDAELLARSTAELEKLQQENNELKLALAQLQKEQEEMMPLSEVEQILNELETLRTSKNELQMQYTDICNKSDLMLNDIHSLQTQMDLLNREKGETAAERDSLRTQLVEIEDKIKMEMEGLQLQNSSLTTNIEKWKQQYEQEVESSKSLAKTVEELHFQINEQKKQIRMVREEEEEWKRAEMLKNHEINILSQQLSETTLENEDLKYKLEMEVKRYKNLEKKLSESETDHQTNQQVSFQVVQQHESEMNELRRKVEEKVHQIGQLHNAHQLETEAYEFFKMNSQKQIDQLQSDLQKAQITLVESEASLQQEMSDKLQQARLEKESLKASLQKSECHIQMLEQDLKKIQESIKQQRECEEFIKNQEQATVTELRERMQQLKQLESELRAENHKYQVEIYSLMGQVEKLQVELANKQTSPTMLQIDQSQLFAETEKLRMEKQSHIDKLAERCRELETIVASHSDVLDAKHMEFEIQKDSMLKTVQSLSSQLENLNIEMAEIRNLNNKLEKQNGELLGHRNPKQKIQQIVKMKQENNELRTRVRQLEAQLDQLSKLQQNKENEDAFSFSLNTSRLNMSRGSNDSLLSLTGPVAANTSTSSTEGREAENLRRQLTTIESAVVNLSKMYSTKKRKFESPSPGIAKTTSFKRVMNILGDLENACPNNRGVRGSNTR